jgi:hypothetical protein
VAALSRLSGSAAASPSGLGPALSEPLPLAPGRVPPYPVPAARAPPPAAAPSAGGGGEGAGLEGSSSAPTLQRLLSASPSAVGGPGGGGAVGRLEEQLARMRRVRGASVGQGCAAGWLGRWSSRVFASA